MTSETDNKVEAAVEFRWSCDDQDSRGGCRNPHGCHCAEITALLSSKEAADQRCDRLAAEVERLKADAWGPAIVRASVALRNRAEAAEAKLSALVYVVEAARDLVMKPGGLVNRGVGVGLVVVEKADKSDPHYRLCIAFEKLESALASLDRTAPESAAHSPSTDGEG